MARIHRFPREDGTVVEVAITERADGDFHIDSPDVADRRARVMPGDWSVVRQVHGAVIVAADPAHAPEADAVYTAEPDRPIAVQGADCAPVASWALTWLSMSLICFPHSVKSQGRTSL